MGFVQQPITKPHKLPAWYQLSWSPAQLAQERALSWRFGCRHCLFVPRAGRGEQPSSPAQGTNRGTRLDGKHFRKGGEEQGREHGEVNGTSLGRDSAKSNRGD